MTGRELATLIGAIVIFVGGLVLLVAGMLGADGTRTDQLFLLGVSLASAGASSLGTAAMVRRPPPP